MPYHPTQELLHKSLTDQVKKQQQQKTISIQSGFILMLNMSVFSQKSEERIHPSEWLSS